MSTLIMQDFRDIFDKFMAGSMVTDLEMATVIDADNPDGASFKTVENDVYPARSVIVPDTFSVLKGETDEGIGVTIDNSLKNNDEVILLRAFGGQTFIVVGRTRKG